MPAYWFMYNFYALERNAWKYKDRDKRTEKIQCLEYGYLAPDTVNEMFYSLRLFETLVGKAFYKGAIKTDAEYQQKGKELLQEKDPVINELKITAEGFENSRRKTVILKIQKAYDLFLQMIFYYGVSHLISFIRQNNFDSFRSLLSSLPDKLKRNNWLNIGGQIIPADDVKNFIEEIHEEKISSWKELHNVYQQLGEQYPEQKILHALASLEEIENISLQKLKPGTLAAWLDKAIAIKEWIVKEIYTSRAKDHSNEFRKMVYNSEEEMNNVLGRLGENSFINQQKKELAIFKTDIEEMKERFIN